MGPVESTLRNELAFSPAPRRTQSMRLDMPAGSTVADALKASGWASEVGLSVETMKCGVWGKVQPLDKVLRDGDRVEIYRPLTVDPKEARRLRYKKQHKA